MCKEKDFFKLLYKNSQPCKQFVLKNNGSADDAKDCIQEAMYVVYKMTLNPDFKLTSKPETLLYSVVKRNWFNKLKQQKNIKMEFEIQDNQEEIDAHLEKEEKLKMLSSKLNTIGEKCKELLYLFYYQKKSMIEIAKQLDFRNDKVAKAMKFKCLDKLKTQIINSK